ncbi:MAG: hypothetical protein LBJ10_06155, partial [Clostridiales bacterium]|nr:hypothetical protein [Clostridiales bacterium]
DGDARVAEQAISFRRGIEPTPCASGSDGASHAGGASANGSGSDCRSGNVCRSGGASHAGSLGAALLEALKANIGFILRSIVRDERAPMHGGAHLFYDYDARTFRQKNWLWTYGPSMRTLLVGMKVPEIARAFGAEEMLAAAAGMGEICLRNLETNPAKPFRGLMLCRYEMTPVNSRLGYELKYSPADGLFQAGWGMIPLYRQTGDPRYLRFCSDMADATGELLERDVVVQQDYYAVTGSWKTNTMNESGFGMEGLAELYRETGDKRYRDIGKKYIDQLIGCLETDEGVWARNYFRHSRRVQPPDYATRGMGWAMMGVSSAARMRLGEPYLRKSVAMAEHVMKHQLGNGGWRYVYNSGSDQLGMSEKGTAVWAAMLFRLCRLTGAQRYRDAAGRAVKWLMGAQYLGPDREGHGGVPIIGPQSGIVYRPYYKMACQYTAGFFGLALLESLGAPTEE